MTGIVTAAMIDLMSSGSDMRATPPSLRMSAGTRSSAITAQAPASWAMRACSGVTTSMITPPRSISAKPRLTRSVPVVRSAMPTSLGGGPGMAADDYGVEEEVVVGVGPVAAPLGGSSTHVCPGVSWNGDPALSV